MPNFKNIIDHYEKCLDEHGYSPKGVDWPNVPDLAKRFQIMLELIPSFHPKPKLLDLGCGTGFLLEYLRSINCLNQIYYQGLDYSQKMIDYARSKWPDYHFLQADILNSTIDPASFDYVILNGVFTEKRDLSHQDMTQYVKQVLRVAFSLSRNGMAFNIMSPHGDWCRTDLFYWPLDDLVSFLTTSLSRHIRVRMDYGLYEYTVYVYRDSQTDLENFQHFIERFEIND